MASLPTSGITIDLEVHRAIEARRNSFDQTSNDILRDVFGLPKAPNDSAKEARNEPTDVTESAIGRTPRTRRTGSYGLVLLGDHFQEESLQGAYRRCLLELSKRDAAFLDRLSEKRTRSRRIVARDPRSLFLKSPGLAEKFAAPLTDEWWVDVNLSQPQVETRLKMACEVAGLSFGGDLILEFPE